VEGNRRRSEVGVEEIKWRRKVRRKRGGRVEDRRVIDGWVEDRNCAFVFLEEEEG